MDRSGSKSDHASASASAAAQEHPDRGSGKSNGASGSEVRPQEEDDEHPDVENFREAQGCYGNGYGESSGQMRTSSGPSVVSDVPTR